LTCGYTGLMAFRLVV